MQNYNNFFTRVFCSCFSRNFYRHVFYESKSDYFSVIILIIAITYIIPTSIIRDRLANFSYSQNDNNIARELHDALSNIPDITISDNILDSQNYPELPQSQYFSVLNKNLFTIDPTQNSLITTNSSILFAEDGIYINNQDLIIILGKMLGLENTPTNIYNNNHSKETPFLPYENNLTKFNGEFWIKWSEKNIRSLKTPLIFALLPSVIIVTSIIKLIEIFFLSFIAKAMAARLGISYNSLQILRITTVAMIPVLIIKLVNAAGLWSSKFLSFPPFSIILLMAINIYFIYFALSSVKQK